MSKESKIRFRRIDWRWNRNCNLNYTTPADVISRVEQAGLREFSISPLFKIVDGLKELYKYGAVFGKDKYSELQHNGLTMRFTGGIEESNREYYFEVWDRETLIVMCRLCCDDAIRSDFGLKLLNRPRVFMSYVLIYISSELADKALLDDLTDSIN